MGIVQIPGDELAAQGFIRTTKERRSTFDELTDEGRIYLQTLERFTLPSRPRPAQEVPRQRLGRV